MRKLIVSMNTSLDGFMSSADEGLDWHFPYWDDAMNDEATLQLSQADTLLLGRKTYQAMAAYWPLRAFHSGFPRRDIAFAEMMNAHRKVVFSRTLNAASWQNARVAARPVEVETDALKKEMGLNILVYGSGSIVHQLMAAQLINEFQVWRHPTVLGSGQPLFTDDKQHQRLQLVGKKTFSSGVVLMHYCTVSEAAAQQTAGPICED